MLIDGGSGDNPRRNHRRGARLGALGASGLIIADLVPAFEARAEALRIIAIGVLLATMIVAGRKEKRRRSSVFWPVP